ncbi:hypothetical protein LZD49_32335 [Dyadobacter sp. CY261]|uniref:T9SS type A sorting domain-containing protein n=1 Tax=Dyadobacter sp. CY261 TaxID=2907203 RepID=UPI001F21D025|nr:T9SS type A sorting domain-containing protein [Dyadobacter sp. CY261]MCF0075216.1 hypothetical protein [Dyadobacter sp. CY261]
MRVFYLQILALLVGVKFSSAQIVTKSLESSKMDLTSGIYGINYSENPVTLVGPSQEEVKRLLKEDSAGIESKGYRIATLIQAKLDVAKDAKWVVRGDTAYGRFAIDLPKATTVSISFERFWLPRHCELHIYNGKGTVAGPITSNENKADLKWGSPIFNGGKIWIEIKLPLRERPELQLIIGSAAFGYKSISKVFGFGDSANCQDNKNVLCYGYSVQRNAICLILSGNGTAICSGSLVNNTCNDNKPYVLTANHCALAEGFNTWRFIFQYWSPQCDPTQDANNYLTFNGATFRANGITSDFLLLELFSQPSGLFGSSALTYLGWDRSTLPTSNVATLHHPSGDVMKVAKSTNATFSSQSAWVDGALVDNSHWGIQWTLGATEGGSSGGPLLNQNNLIIGQLHGGTSVCEPSQGGVDWYGKFDWSWTGNGTNGTRLSNWLDPKTANPTTMNGIGVHYLSGPDLICSSGNFSIVNLPAGMSVTWSSSNSSGLTITSSGVATRVNNYSGPITITATINLSGCVALTKVKNIWVGSPVLTYMTYGVTGTSAGSSVLSVNNVNASPFFYWVRTNIISGSTTWSVTPSINGYVSDSHEYTFSLNSGQQADFNINTTNSCGSSSRTTRFRNTSTLLSVYPNPAEDVITIEVNGAMPSKIELYSEESTMPIHSVETSKMATGQSASNSVSFNVRELARGKYFIHATYANSKTIEKIQVLLK